MTNVINLSNKFSERKPLQLELFSKNSGKNTTLEFFDLFQSNHGDFLYFLSTHSIKVILDIRDSIAFPKYRYQHKSLFQYFNDYQISYKNTASTIKSLKSSSISLWLMSHGKEFREYVLENLKLGPCAVLYDSNINNDSAELYRKLIASEFRLSELISIKTMS